MSKVVSEIVRIFISLNSPGIRINHEGEVAAPLPGIHFFTPAIQFSTTVNGGWLASSALVINRNRCPSPVAA
jgi:hypothetical protein